MTPYQDIRRAVGAYQMLVSVNPFISREMNSSINTSKELLDNYRNSNSTAVFSSEDAGFIELKHDFKYTHGTKASKGPTISLKCYDPGIGFLTKLYFDFIGRSLSKINDAKELEQTVLKDYYEKLTKAEDEIKRLELNIDALLNDGTYRRSLARSEAARRQILPESSVPVSVLVPYLTDEDPFFHDIEESIREKLGEAMVTEEEILGEIQVLISQRTLPKVYIMYGVGQDLNDWAGPFETYLGEVRHDNDGKNETTEYIFSVDLLSEQFADSTLFKKRSKIDKISFYDKVSVPIAALHYTRPITGAGRYTRVHFPNRPTNFHDCIVGLMSSYLFQVGIKNHLIVLPDINSILGPLVTAALINVLSTTPFLRKYSRVGFRPGGFFSLTGSTNDPTRLAAPWDDLEGKAKEQALFYFLSDLFNADNADGLKESLADIYQIDLGRDMNESTTKINHVFTFAGIEIIKRVFESIGLRQSSAETRSSSVDPALKVNQLDFDIDDVDSYVTCNNPFDVQNFTRGWSFGQIQASKILRLNFADATEEGDAPLDNWAAPLDDLINGINACTGGDIIRLTSGYVTNLELEKKIKDRFGGGTYLGYASFPGAPPVDETPLFVIGDREVIRLLIYGEFHKLVSSDPNFSDLDYLSDVGDFPSTMIVRGGRATFLKDPFWAKSGEAIWDTINGDRNYLSDMYYYLHPQNGGVNFGYFNGLLAGWEGLKATLPDEFAANWSDEDYQNMFELDIPVFLANTEGANILSYSFDVNKFIYGSLFGSIQEIYYNTSRRYLRENNPIFEGSLDETVVLEKTKEIMDNLRASHSFTGAGMTVATGIGSPVDPEEVYDNLARLLMLENQAGPQFAVNKGRGSSVVAFLLLFLDIFERQFIGNIKTLPMFHLSTHYTINKSCLASLKSVRKVSPSPLGLDGKREEENDVADYLSGMYRVLGFQHVITSNDAYSEFSLVKDVISEMSNVV